MSAINNAGIGEAVSSDGAIPTCDVLVAGLPGPLMTWTVDLVAGALAERFAAIAHLPIGGEVRWSPPNVASDPAARLYTGDFVGGEWATMLRTGGILGVLVLDDTGLAWDALRQFGQSVSEATHNLVTVATSFGDLVGKGRVLTVTRADCADPVTLAAQVLAHLGLQVGFTMPDAGRYGNWPSLPSITNELGPFIDTVLRPAFEYGRNGKRLPVTWSRDCLYWGDSPGNALPRVLDLTGPSRILAYGPYLALPPGRWTMIATFALSPASRGAILSLTLHSGENALGSIEFTVEGPGLFKASVPVVVTSPREHLEIRLVSKRGAIEGTIGIDGIAFTPD